MPRLNFSKKRLEFGRTILFGAFAFLSPFIILYWVVPFASDLTIGNDYVMFTPSQSQNLQYSLEKGSFPLFVPGLACGRSSAALTLGQVYHPLPHLARMMPDYWGGDALANSTLLRLLMLGIANLLICVFLRRLGLSRPIALLLGLVTVCNFRMLDLFRYGASLENYTGYLFLSCSLGFYCLKPSRVLGPVSIILSSYLLVCGGHPQMMYYGLIGVGVIYLALPFALAAIQPEFRPSRTSLWRYFAFSGVSIGVGILLAANYIVPFYFEFLSNNIRTAHSYAWSLGYGDSWGGTLNAFFTPLMSDVHGNFGSTALLVLVMFLPLLLLLRVRLPLVMLLLWLAALVGILCAMGKATPVHSWFWHSVPFANSFRTPGRATMILPFIFLLLLAWLFRQNEQSLGLRRFQSLCSPILPIAAVSLGVFYLYNVYLVEMVPSPAHYVPGARTPRPPWIDSVVYWSGLGTIGLAIVYGIKPLQKWTGFKTVLGLLLLLGVVVQLTAELRYGTWVKKQSKSRTLVAMDRSIQRDIRHRVLAGYGLEEPAVTDQMNASILEPKLAKFYRKYKVVGSDARAMEFLKTRRDAQTAVIVAPELGLGERQNSEVKLIDRIKLIYSSFNRLVFEVDARGPGIFALSFPYSDQWNAMVGGKNIEVSKTNGYSNGLFLPVGKHQVELKYRSPATIAGFAFSTLLAVLLAGFFVCVAVSPGWRELLCVICLVSGSAFFMKWMESLYAGENLDVRYEWNSQLLPNPDNIAYGRTTRFYRIRTMEESFRYYAGLAVDGDRRGKPFRTTDDRLPWWEVDLGGVREFSRIDIYDSHQAKQNLPLLLQVSNDRKRFTTVLTLTTRPREHPWRLTFAPLSSRYIRLSSQKKSSMQFREIEVY